MKAVIGGPPQRDGRAEHRFHCFGLGFAEPTVGRGDVDEDDDGLGDRICARTVRFADDVSHRHRGGPDLADDEIDGDGSGAIGNRGAVFDRVGGHEQLRRRRGVGEDRRNLHATDGVGHSMLSRRGRCIRAVSRRAESTDTRFFQQFELSDVVDVTVRIHITPSQFQQYSGEFFEKGVGGA